MGGFKKAVKRMALFACAPFFNHSDDVVSPTAAVHHPVPAGSVGEIEADEESMAACNSLSTAKSLCAICLDPLSGGKGNVPDQAIFTAQCSHAFHFACITSNVRHGNVTCPICRAHWTQLPRNLNPPVFKQNDPVLRILDDSIASFRGHRRSFLRSATYDDDDPLDQESHYAVAHPRLLFSLMPVPQNQPTFHPYTLRAQGQLPYCQHYLATPPSLVPFEESYSPSGRANYLCPPTRSYLTVKLAPQQPTDLVLVASPNGPHLRLLKQSMALVVSSLRSVDRLAIVAYSSSAARVFPLRRMTAYGKRTALHIIDRLFYMGQADPAEGLKKGVKILADRTHKNPTFSILHLSDNPTRPYHAMDMEMEMPIPIHRFHVGYGYGTSNGFVMHEFEEFLTRVLGGVIRETQLHIGDETRIIRLGELRGGEERRIPLNVAEYQQLYIGYSYLDEVSDECIRTGETMVCLGEKRLSEEANAPDRDVNIGGRISSAENWDYHDPYMARRWSKYLHGYRL